MGRALLVLFVCLEGMRAASVHTDFEGGSLGPILKLSTTHFRLSAKGEKDQDGRNRQANWYYFRVDKAGSQELIFDIVDLAGEYNYQPNRGAVTKDTPPVISYDGKNWVHLESFEYEAAEPRMVLRVRPKGSQFWIAHTPPYVGADLAKLRSDIRGNPAFREEVIGKTLGGRDMLLWTIAEPDQVDRKVVWLMFRQHSWESGSSWVGEGAIRSLLGAGDEAQALRRRVTWKIFPLCDPDGVARGGVRFNTNGYDLNRNWDVDDRVKMPEITAQRQSIRAWLSGGKRIDLFFSLHNTETSEYLQGPPDGVRNPVVATLAQRLFAALTEHSTFAPTRPLFYAEESTTVGKPGRMTVIQGLHAQFQTPGFLMEQRVSYNPKLGHLPLVADRLRFGGELIRALDAALSIRLPQGKISAETRK